MDKESIERSFSQTLIQASELESQGEVRRAYDLLQSFLEQHAAEDTETWLSNAVKFNQGSILRFGGDLTGALEKHREVWARPGDRPFFLLNAFCIARILDDLGETERAFAELRTSLDVVEGPPQKTDVGTLLLYADLSQRLSQPLPQEHLEIIKVVVGLWGVQLDDEELGDHKKVMAALRDADAKVRSGSPCA